jgi:hypothetical protein
MGPETAQDQQDEILTSRKITLPPRPEFEALVAKSESGSSQSASSRGYDPLARALKDNPTLTREKVEAMAQAFGL